MLRGEKWSHCTGIAAFFLPNAVKSSKHVNVGQHSIILGFRECDTGQFLWKLQKESGFFFFQTDTQLDTSSVSPPNPNMIS